MFLFEETKLIDIGSLGQKNEKVILQFKKSYTSELYMKNLPGLITNNITYKFLGDLTFKAHGYNWEEYKRTKKSILDTFTYICSIAPTIYNLIKTGFQILYSNSFNNYKIIEKLFFDKDKKMKKNKKVFQEIKLAISSDFLIDNDKEKEINEVNESDENINVSDDELENNSKINLPKLSFFSYIFSFFYCQNCRHRLKNQILISKCNEIVSKYYSIDNIIYNQMRFELMLKDYKWNEPKYKISENNELVVNLNNYLKNNYLDING